MSQPAGAIHLRHPAVPYVAPFAVLIAVMGCTASLGIEARIAYPLRTVAVLGALLLCSRGVVSLRPAHALGSVLLGIGVFLVWIGPSVLWPAYRSGPLFNNSLVGVLGSPGAPAGIGLGFLLFRAGGSSLLVPVAEELFWRSWLMRWLIRHEFLGVPLGTYAPQAFWISAALFAVEHGSFWDVGLAAGVAYNWWMVRTRSLADCILAHAVTNACLATYVLAFNRWEYWA